VVAVPAIEVGMERSGTHWVVPPVAAEWPEIAAVRRAAVDHADVCKVSAPVGNVYFAKELEELGTPVPDGLLALYAACDGFDLACIAAPLVPVFRLLASGAIDESEEGDGFPYRAVVFHGGDDVQLCVYRDATKVWWLVYEHEYVAVAKKALHLRDLLRFGLARMNAGEVGLLQNELGWERFFGVKK
jgi:hypothetical protein